MEVAGRFATATPRPAAVEPREDDEGVEGS